MKTVRCPQCNLVNWNTVLICNRCGFDIQSFIENEQSTESEMSFEQGASLPSAQNSYSFHEQNTTNFETRQNSNQSFHEDFQPENSYNRQTRYDYQQESYGTNKNYQNRNFGNSGRTKKGLAITSLVLGILGMPWFSLFLGGFFGVIFSLIFGGAGFVIGFALPLLIPVVSLITGIISIKRANKNPLEFGGKGLAIGGISCSALWLLVIPIVAAIAVPNLLAARRAANEGSAISSIRTVASAENLIREQKGIGCVDLTELSSEGLIDNVLAKGEKNGYRFIVTKLPNITRDCAITATPISESSGSRAFYYSTEDNQIRTRKYTGKMADMNDEPISQATFDY